LPLDSSNDNSKSIKSIAVIGPDAGVAVISGGGSASLAPSYTVTPFDAIKEVAREVLGLKPKDIKYSRGGNAHKWAPLFVGLSTWCPPSKPNCFENAGT
jgi:beta-glucosidase